MFSTLHSQFTDQKEIAFSSDGREMQTEAEKEISRLQKELDDTRTECDILKKSQASSSRLTSKICVHNGASDGVFYREDVC